MFVKVVVPLAAPGALFAFLASFDELIISLLSVGSPSADFAGADLEQPA